MPAPKGERNPGEVVLRAPRGAMREWCPHCGRKGLLCLGALGAKRRDRAGYTWAIAASASSSATRTWRRSGRPDRTASGTSHLTTDRARFLGFGLSQRAGTDAAKCPVSLWLCRDAGRSLPINKICPERSAGRERRQGAPTRLAPVRTKRRASSAVKEPLSKAVSTRPRDDL